MSPAKRSASRRSAGQADDRPWQRALWRGFGRRCPACGARTLMAGYLKVAPACTRCGEDYSHQRADDGPAYLTILIVGKLLAPAIFWVFVTFRPDPAVMAAGFSAATVVLALWLLPRIKGGFVALQWSRRMHGFGGAEAA
ncbi:MAG: DUF983 domain-containing protein [Alphaproteobacteria bacterium]|nr:DUF983 domain-containing protein [Alphaproteobacteria bacterium]